MAERRKTGGAAPPVAPPSGAPPPAAAAAAAAATSGGSGNLRKGGVNGTGKPAPPRVFERLKVVSMGSGGTGKSCLIKRFCEDRFVTKYIATIGVDYGVKPLRLDPTTELRINFWDLSGHAEFFEIRNEFYKDAQAALLVYDVTSRDTFEDLDGWLAECAKFGPNPRELPIALCANKIEKGGRVVSEEEGRAFASSRGLQYFEVSAATGQNVSDMFQFLFNRAYRKIKATV